MPNITITAQQAVQAAFSYVGEMYSGQAQDILLEEIELRETEVVWAVTVSFVRVSPLAPVGSTGLITQSLGARAPRLYKALEIDAETGAVRAMRIRSHD